MNFICSKQKLQEGISIVTKAITGKTTMPILEGIYIEANNEGVTLIGSDMDVSIETKVEATVITPGKIVLDARLFGEIIRKLPNSDVKIEIADNDLIQVTCEKSVFNLVYMNPSDYPMLPTINEDLKVEVPQNLLKNMIKGTSFAIAQDEARPILQGILFEVKDKQLNLVALDGYRLAIRNELLDIDNDIEVVIPGKTLNEVSKILEDNSDLVEITFTNNHILFNLKTTKVISRLLEGKFVNYNSLLPQEHKLIVNVKKQELQNGIERASLMAKDGNSNLIKLDVQEDYPMLPTINEDLKVEVPQNLLKNMIKGTSFAIAQDEARPILQGILFEVKDKQLNLVALDGYRLAIRNELLDIDNDIEVVIPGKTLNEVSKILEDNSDLVEITFTNNHILFNLKTTKVISRLLEGKFVNYNSLLPQEHKLIVNVKKQELQNGIERASLMAKDGNSNLIKLDVQEDILIITSNSQLGKVREEVAINLQGEEVQIAFNSRYLLDVLKNMEEEEIVMEMTSGITPCVIKGKNMNNSKYLVLPVRLVR